MGGVTLPMGEDSKDGPSAASAGQSAVSVDGEAASLGDPVEAEAPARLPETGKLLPRGKRPAPEAVPVPEHPVASGRAAAPKIPAAPPKSAAKSAGAARCAACGAPLKPGQRFCGQCGTPTGNGGERP